MLALLEYLAALVLTVVAVWRAPAVRYGDAYRRSLWGIYAGFAVTLWLSTPGVMHLLNAVPVVDLSVLLKHLVGAVALMSMVTYVATSYGKTSEPVVPRHIAASRWMARFAPKGALIVMVLMTVFFFTVVDRKSPSADFVTDHTGQWGAAAYLSVFYFYTIAVATASGYQWTGAFRRAETRLLRTGLLLMAVSMWMGVIYTAARIALIWIDVAAPLSHATDQQVVTWTAVWFQVFFLMLALGTSVPATRAVAARWRAWNALRCLYPLWRDLVTTFPGTSFAPPAPRLRELTRFSLPVDVRLDRWVADITDVEDKLRHYAPPELLSVAEDAAERHPDPEPAAEAYWIKAALQAAAAGRRLEVASAALPTKPIVDTRAQESWLLRVRKAYASITAAQAGQLLAEAEQEPAV
ncbi:hypothetical protein AV521_13190 [Streptomyces sp. IMTB 2501]|nr:hypothetical protein AV521_13190 [Streptomyces sp. IMTB 2501]